MKKLLVAATAATALLVGLVALGSTGAFATAEANNWYTCKYIGPPSSPNETLAGGQNPIFTDEAAILAQTGLQTVSIGDEFADGQDQSVVIAGPYSPPGIDPEPVCPGATSPPPPCPTGTTTITVTHTVDAPVPSQAAAASCTVTVTTTVTRPPSPTSTTPPPAGGGSCPGSFHLGPWYGDPRINIDLRGAGTFVVSGGIQRFTDQTTITKTLACGETFRIGRYKVSRGHFLTITLNGAVVVHVKPPRIR